RLGQFVFAQAPASFVHFVNALVAEVAVAVIPHPVPVVVDGAEFGGVAVGELVGGRAAPQIVIHRLGRLLRAVHLADTLAPLVAQTAGQLDLAEFAFVQEGHRLLQAGAATALGAGLADLVVLAGGLDDAAAFADVVANGLLEVDV